MRVSINELGKLTGKDRATVRKRLEELESEPGPHGAQMYDSKQALEAIYLGGGGDYQSAAKEKARLDHHRANREELLEKKMRGDLVEFDAVVRAVSEMIAAAKAKFMAMPARVAQRLPVEPAVRRQAQEYMKEEVFSGLDELSERNLEGVEAVDADMEGAADADGKRVGRTAKAAQSRGKRRARKVEKRQGAASG